MAMNIPCGIGKLAVILCNCLLLILAQNHGKKRSRDSGKLKKINRYVAFEPFGRRWSAAEKTSLYLNASAILETFGVDGVYLFVINDRVLEKQVAAARKLGKFDFPEVVMTNPSDVVGESACIDDARKSFQISHAAVQRSWFFDEPSVVDTTCPFGLPIHSQCSISITSSNATASQYYTETHTLNCRKSWPSPNITLKFSLQFNHHHRQAYLDSQARLQSTPPEAINPKNIKLLAIIEYLLAKLASHTSSIGIAISSYVAILLASFLIFYRKFMIFKISNSEQLRQKQRRPRRISGPEKHPSSRRRTRPSNEIILKEISRKICREKRRKNSGGHDRRRECSLVRRFREDLKSPETPTLSDQSFAISEMVGTPRKDFTKQGIPHLPCVSRLNFENELKIYYHIAETDSVTFSIGAFQETPPGLLKFYFTDNQTKRSRHDLNHFLHESEPLLSTQLKHQNLLIPTKAVSSQCATAPVFLYYKLPKSSPETDNLKRYLQRRSLDVTSRLKICLDLVYAVEYLAGRGMYSCEIAARNCWVSFGADGSAVCRLSDASGSRSIFPREYEKGKPVRWFALEQFYDDTPSRSSNIWSLGVAFWEVFTSGVVPYSGMKHCKTQLAAFLKQGYRLNKPTFMPTDIYQQVLGATWHEHPTQRITLQNIIARLTYSYDALRQVII